MYWFIIIFICRTLRIEIDQNKTRHRNVNDLIFDNDC